MRCRQPERTDDVAIELAHVAAVAKPGNGQVGAPGLQAAPVPLLHDGQVKVGKHAVRLLGRQTQDGVDISCVVSNHARERSSHLRQFCERKNVNFFYVPAGGPARPGQLRSHEPAVLSLISRNSDFVVLARFMQILSSRFLRELGKDVINIHHGLLPSFKGAHPYRQAYNAGVKVIGATAHFVTEELDCGPIIEQQVARVSHRDTVAQFAEKSRSLEKSCLFQAVKLYSEARVVRSGNGRVVVLQ